MEIPWPSKQNRLFKTYISVWEHNLCLPQFYVQPDFLFILSSWKTKRSSFILSFSCKNMYKKTSRFYFYLSNKSIFLVFHLCHSHCINLFLKHISSTTNPWHVFKLISSAHLLLKTVRLKLFFFFLGYSQWLW